MENLSATTVSEVRSGLNGERALVFNFSLERGSISFFKGSRLDRYVVHICAISGINFRIRRLRKKAWKTLTGQLGGHGGCRMCFQNRQELLL